MRKLRSPGARKPCMSPKTIAMICEDCMKKIHAYARNGEPR